MTVIGAPWYLAKHYPTAHVLGTVMIVTAAVNLVFGPYAGALIDRHKRRTILMAENIAGFVGLSAMAALGLFGEYSLYAVAGIYIFTVMIFNVHFPATFALAQESFPRAWYGRISGLLEVITQTAAIVAGGLTGMILESFGLPLVFAIDAITYVFAFAMIAGFRYDAVVGVNAAVPQFMNEMRTAVRYLRSRPHFTMLNIALYLPFVVLITIDVIHPFYVQRTLHAQANVYSLIEGFYAVGATAAGLWMRRIAGNVGDRAAYISAFLLFTGALCVMAAVPMTGLALGAMVGVGWANAGIRVNRVSFVMHEVPPALIGRVNTFFNWIGLVIRGAVLLVLTWAIDAWGPQWSYAFEALLIVLALLLYLQQERPAAREHEARGAPITDA